MIKKSIACIVSTKKHLMEKAHGVLMITFLEMLQYLECIIVHHLTPTVLKMIFLF